MYLDEYILKSHLLFVIGVHKYNKLDNHKS